MLTLVLSASLSLAASAADLSRARKIGERCWQDVQVLAHDDMEGRRPGSAGHRRAAQFVAEQFRKARLVPASDTGFLQPVSLESRVIDEPKSSLALIVGGETRPLKLGDDAAFMFRGNFAREVEAPLVFIGHGLRLPQYGVDDLAGLDLRGKVVVAFSSAPAHVPGAAGAHFSSAAERWKLYGPAGAVGMITIQNPYTMDLPWERAVLARLEPYMVLKGADDQFAGQKLWLQFNPARVSTLLSGSAHDPQEILELLKQGKPLPHFDLPARISARAEVHVEQLVSENVVGVLPGSDPELRDEYVVLSAHLDHLGVGAESADDPQKDRLYNGAMDNASGIAVLLQIARELGKRKAPRRSIMFAAVTAEEMGLLGSRAHVVRAQAQGQRLVANLNTDMFLPLYPLRQLTVFGLDESELGEDVRAVAASMKVDVQPDPQPLRNRFIRSDQYSYIRAGIPALATKVGFTAGTPEAEVERRWFAERYHAPSDEVDQPVDLAAVGQYAELIKRLAVRIAQREVAAKWYPSSVFAGL
jgi:hypothetical protein